MIHDTDTIEIPPSPTGDGLPPLAQLVDVTALQRLQNHFAAMANISICVCNPEGRLITAPTWASAFLRIVTRTAAGRALCEESIRRAATHASAEEVPLAVEGGVSLYGTPIHYRGHRLGTLVIGVRPPKKFSPGIVRNIAALAGVDAIELGQAAELVPAWTAQDRKATFQFVDLLAETIATLYTQALQIRKQLHDLQIVHELTQLLTGEYDLDSILDQTARRVVTALGVKACGIRILDETTGELVIRAVHGLSEEYLHKPPILLENNEIDLAAFQGRTVYIEDARTDPRIRFRDKSAKEGIVSGLCVPLTHRGRTVGVLRVYTGDRRYFGPDEIELVRSIAAQAAAAIINSRLADERIQAEHLQRQLRNAAQVQRRMIPQEPPRHAAIDVGSVYAPTLEVGGDFFDFVEMPDGGLGVGIADVVGKGVPAALMMASLRSVMRTYAMQGRRPADVLLYLNHALCRDTEPSEFATLFFGVINADASALSYGNAGHEPPLLLRGDRFVRLETGGLVIGAFHDAHFADAQTPLHPGDLLVLTTDGTTEAMSFEGGVFGRDRLKESILRHRDLSAQQLAAQVLWDIRRFAGLKEQSDDIALVVIRVLGFDRGGGVPVSPNHPEG
ncbi:MAG: hypothetical protein FLDDKLPJ_02369 [Phycisphaerae bacterium]|nr:hypothetical protein [Phycisphaerae bacterium]